MSKVMIFLRLTWPRPLSVWRRPFRASVLEKSTLSNVDGRLLNLTPTMMLLYGATRKARAAKVDEKDREEGDGKAAKARNTDNAAGEPRPLTCELER